MADPKLPSIYLHEEGRRDQADLDLRVLGVASLSGAECSLDGIDALVTEAGDLDIGAHLDGLGGQALGNI